MVLGADKSMGIEILSNRHNVGLDKLAACKKQEPTVFAGVSLINDNFQDVNIDAATHIFAFGTSIVRVYYSCIERVLFLYYSCIVRVLKANISLY
jgi:hypothetical protein